MQVTSHLFAALPALAAGQAPSWVHLVPAGTFAGVDGRGPYTLADPDKVIAASLAGGKLAIDENHAIDLASPNGGPSPARGWIVELESRADGLWGKVEWTPTGVQLMADHAYRGISPALSIDKATGRVMRLLRASLVNQPNLALTTLHQRSNDNMDLIAKLRTALGLADDADGAAVCAAVEKLQGTSAQASTALQAQLGPIAKAAGLKEDAEAATVLGTVTTLAAGAKSGEAVTALQAELATVTTKLNTLTSNHAKDAATAFVDGAIAKGRVGVKPLRDHYIAMHAADPVRVEKEIGAFPILGPSGALTTPPGKDGQPGLSAEEAHVVTLMGLDAEAYRKTKAALAATEEVL